MTQIHFKGKTFVYNHHLSVPDRPLEPDTKKSIGKPRMDGNLIIHGDNLHALKSLLPMYGGRVNCIYIDPPYNTGNEGWCYNDNVSAPQMQAWLQENPVGIEDGLRHDKWCAMMWPRLELLHNLLAEDGIIFVSIDDNEQHRLRMMMDEIFGADNFIGVIAWKKTTGDNKPSFAFTHDNIIIFGKNHNTLPRQLLTPTQKQQYRNLDNDPRGDWAPSDYRSKWTKSERKNLYYAITNPNTGKKIYPDTDTDSNRVWGMSATTHAENEKAGIVWWGEDGKSNEPKKKRFLSEHIGVNTRSVWLNEGTNDDASQMLSEIFDGNSKVFNNPKPVSLVKRIISLIAKEKDSIILDSFAGSGTTAHATLALNKEDGGNRKFILVECESYANETTAERVRRVIKGIPKTNDKELQKGLSGEFTYCTLGEALDMEKILSGNKLPTYKKLADVLFRTATNETINPDKIDEASHYIGESANYHVWLIYKPSLKFLFSPESAFTLEKARSFAKSKRSKKRHLVFASVRFVSEEVLTTADNGKSLPVEYQPLPWALYKTRQWE